MIEIRLLIVFIKRGQLLHCEGIRDFVSSCNFNRLHYSCKDENFPAFLKIKMEVKMEIINVALLLLSFGFGFLGGILFIVILAIKMGMSDERLNTFKGGK